ncbi:dienelactone hydrolase family protein [Flagellatimonas centrodinii]|uniref:dienelactone hydrolase family protein n=1 Tax=Flagellatimonas centrodinii TaxID=2806210 RepID=UPI001FEEE060|nr:dienelactone hydrolase family protein [Flagellatimonas centrodinii]ULQ46222.1 dienelactone hydrolase family protein [Flagellatimonas centrodinii]
MHAFEYGLRPLNFRTARPAAAGFSRRRFLTATLASGFALAAQPVRAQTITTDSDGLVAGEVEVPVADGHIPAYRAMPASGTGFPVLLVVQEIFGVHAHLQDVCRRYAKQGYFAIAPEMFVRQGDVSGMSDVGAILSEVVSKVPDAQVMSDLDATVAYADSTGKADAGRLGIVGYCWGGRTVWLYAHHNPSVKAGVAYYGLLNGMKGPLKPVDPVDIAADLKVPVLGLYAGADAYIHNDALVAMRAGLRQGRTDSEIIVFPGVQHGFNADYRPSYDRVAAEYAAGLARGWLSDHGV